MKVYVVEFNVYYYTSDNLLGVIEWIVKIFDSKEKAVKFCESYGTLKPEYDDTYSITDKDKIEELYEDDVDENEYYELQIYEHEVK